MSGITSLQTVLAALVSWATVVGIVWIVVVVAMVEVLLCKYLCKSSGQDRC